MIVVKDIVYTRCTSPDLDRMATFLTDFGLHVQARTATRLYMRAAGPQPFAHVTELGPDHGPQGIGLWAQSLDDLHRLAAATDTQVRDSEEPGGGKVVTLRDPAGMRVDVVFGQSELAPLPMRERLEFNFATAGRLRGNRTQRFAVGPSTVTRLGHVVMRVPDIKAALDWYMGLFGMRIADSFYAGQPDRLMVAFLRCGLGKTLTDHHTIALAQPPVPAPAGFDHTAFEVLDFDDLAVGNEHLRSKGYPHAWGIGRHIEGSQIFDYWRDPNGVKIEHWTDGDSINDDYVPSNSAFGGNSLAVWAPPVVLPDFMS